MTDTQKDGGPLLPCPFCGSPANGEYLEPPEHVYWVECSNEECKAQGGIMYEREAAVAAWGLRYPQPDPVRDELVVLLAEFLNQIDDEDQVIHIEPSGGCIECTAGTRPNNMDTGLCLRHRAEAALSKAKEGQS